MGCPDGVSRWGVRGGGVAGEGGAIRLRHDGSSNRKVVLKQSTTLNASGLWRQVGRLGRERRERKEGGGCCGVMTGWQLNWSGTVLTKGSKNTGLSVVSHLYVQQFCCIKQRNEWE